MRITSVFGAATIRLARLWRKKRCNKFMSRKACRQRLVTAKWHVLHEISLLLSVRRPPGKHRRFPARLPWLRRLPCGSPSNLPAELYLIVHSVIDILEQLRAQLLTEFAKSLFVMSGLAIFILLVNVLSHIYLQTCPKEAPTESTCSSGASRGEVLPSERASPTPRADGKSSASERSRQSLNRKDSSP